MRLRGNRHAVRVVPGPRTAPARRVLPAPACRLRRRSPRTHLCGAKRVVRSSDRDGFSAGSAPSTACTAICHPARSAGARPARHGSRAQARSVRPPPTTAVSSARGAVRSCFTSFGAGGDRWSSGPRSPRRCQAPRPNAPDGPPMNPGSSGPPAMVERGPARRASAPGDLAAPVRATGDTAYTLCVRMGGRPSGCGSRGGRPRVRDSGPRPASGCGVPTARGRLRRAVGLGRAS